MSSQESTVIYFIPDLVSRAAFAGEKMQKLDVVESHRFMLGLNCFEPGQNQRAHVHQGADKFYLVLSGRASVRVGADVRDARAGDLVWAPAGIEHGVETAHERTVMMVGITR